VTAPARSPWRLILPLTFVFLLGLLFPVILAHVSGGGSWGAELSDPVTWQRLASPGDLSTAHHGLDCAACHTPVDGVDRNKCVTCHATASALLQRQPTAFHADVKSCRECHLEHQGGEVPPVEMDHQAFARIGIRELQGKDGEDTEAFARFTGISNWLQAAPSRTSSGLGPEEATLDCSKCHANDDRHFDLFGSDCAACHRTEAWTIPAFQHPPPSSRDCVQCHQAPPSHYMMHFHMVSRRVANRPHADVRQCFICHQTTSWPDIKGVGWYKHH